jgi:hypothetical protein
MVKDDRLFTTRVALFARVGEVCVKFWIRRPDQRDALANDGGRRRRTEGQVSRDTFLTHDGVR